MKRFAIGLLLVALVLGFTACSQDFSAKMGNGMNKMGNNIYGIKYNSIEVDKAAIAVDNSISEDGSVDINKAADIMKLIDGIKKSEQKSEALREKLQEPAGTTAGQLASSIGSTKTSLETKIAALEDGNQKTVANAINIALAAVEDSVSENPTKAEVATVAILNEMAKTIISLDDASIETIAQEGQEALDALLLVTGFGSMDLLGELGLQDIIAGGSESKAVGDNTTTNNLLQQIVSGLTELISADRKFNQNRYNSFILQARIMRSAYDMISLQYVRNATDYNDYDYLLNANINHGLDAEDLAKYIVSWLFVEFDNILGHEVIGSTLGALINETNYNKLTDLGNEEKQFDSDAIQAAGPVFFNAAFSAFGINLDAIAELQFPQLTNYTDDQLLESILKADIQASVEDDLWNQAIADQEGKYFGVSADNSEKKAEFLDENFMDVFIATEDAYSTYNIPDDPTSEEQVPENIETLQAERTAALRTVLLSIEFGYSEETLQTAMEETLKEKRESDAMFSVLAIMMQLSQIFNPETGKEAVKDLSTAVQALPGDFMRFVGTTVVILRDSEWDGALLALAGVPANEEHKVAYMFGSLRKSILGIDTEDAE